MDAYGGHSVIDAGSDSWSHGRGMTFTMPPSFFWKCTCVI